MSARTDDTAADVASAGSDGQPTRRGAGKDGPPISRLAAVGLLVLAAAGAVAGPLAYRQAPALGERIVDVELAGERLPAVDPRVLEEVLRWDLALVLGYGVALVCGAVLARMVLWSPLGKRLGRIGLPLALLTVGADLLENVLLLWDVQRPRDWLLVAASVCAVCKFCALVPAVAIALAGWLTAAVRLCVNRPTVLAKRAADPVQVHPRGPLETDREVDDEGTTLIESGASTDRGRWRRGYQVPGVQQEIDDERFDANRTRVKDTVGFSLSGGGVRSASVSLGALQTLRDELVSARYLASVSGGGYTAGALQLALTDAGAAHVESLGTVVRDPRSALMPGSVDEDRLRRHASYLANSPAQMLVALGVLARTVVLSIATLFGPAILIGLLVGAWYAGVPLVEWPERGYGLTRTPRFPDVRPETLMLLGGLAAVAFLTYALSVVLTAAEHGPDSGRERLVRTLRALASGVTGFALLVAVLAVGLPAAVYASAWLLHGRADQISFGAPLGTVLLAYGTTIVAIGRQKKVRARVAGLFKRSSPVASVPSGALQLVLVVLALLTLAAGWLLLLGGVAAIQPRLGRTEEALTVLALVVALGFLGGLLDQTVLSLHPFYRRRLAGTFAARRVTSRAGHSVAYGYDFAERTTLSTYGRRVEWAAPDGTRAPVMPEPVYVAAANLTGEELTPLNAVSFTFTGDWVGGPDIGYVRTADLERIVKPQLARDLTVQAAVAISGAAVASAMGRAGRWFGTLLAVTGARLGTWLPNPSHVARWRAAAARDDWTMSGLPRVRRLPYLLREVLGMHSIEDRMLQVTDGGHYENLGLIELFRRRCNVIYCIDASGDGPPTASTLANAATLAYEELGVEVRLPSEAWRLAPGSGAPLGDSPELAELNKRLAGSAVFVAPFSYPPESGLPEGELDGVLYVGKASLTADLDYALLSYATRNSVFPHDSTGDQFFDDDKYCAYTGLGRALGGQLRAAVRTSRQSPVPTPIVVPATAPASTMPQPVTTATTPVGAAGTAAIVTTPSPTATLLAPTPAPGTTQPPTGRAPTVGQPTVAPPRRSD